MKPMTLVLSALALGWCVADARAVDSPYSGMPRGTNGQPAASGAVAPGATPNFQYGPDCGTCGSSCLDGCGHGCGGFRFYIGGGATYMQPRWETDPAYLFALGNLGNFTVPPNTETPIIVQPINTGLNTELSFAYDFEIAPRIWVGVVNDCGCGIRARYWGIEQDAEKFVDLSSRRFGTVQIGTTTPIAFDFERDSFGGARSNLDFKVYDLELTYEGNCCGAWVISGGLRYVDINQDYDAQLDATIVANGGPTNQVTVDHNELVRVSDSFQAFGPTAAIEGRCPLGCFNLYLFSSARISLLIGHGEENASRNLSQVVTVITPTDRSTDNFTAEGSALRDRDDIYWVGELEVGIECCKECQGVELTGRIALVAQSWYEFGLPTDAIVPVDSFNGLATVGMRNRDKVESDLHFYGVTLVAGVRF